MSVETIYQNLMVQVDKLYRHNRQGSYLSRDRYYEAMKRFCRFLAEVFRLERLANIAPKHIFAYVDHLEEGGKSPSTIKTDLSAIRFYHDLIQDPRYELPDNSALMLTRRSFGHVDRTWSDTEFQKMCALAEQDGHSDYVTILHLARYAGLRIHECFRIDTATAADAVKKGSLTIKGKGGLIRTIPLTEDLQIRLKSASEQIPRGKKLFVPDDKKTHEAIEALHDYIGRNRQLVQDFDSDRPMSFHGLRHTYAAEQYQSMLSKGYTIEMAEKAVSALLGHHRRDVTRIYLASLKAGESDG